MRKTIDADKDFFFFFGCNLDADQLLSCLTQTLNNYNFSTLERLFDESYYLSNCLMELVFALCCLYKTLGIVIFLELFM